MKESRTRMTELEVRMLIKVMKARTFKVKIRIGLILLASGKSMYHKVAMNKFPISTLKIS